MYKVTLVTYRYGRSKMTSKSKSKSKAKSTAKSTPQSASEFGDFDCEAALQRWFQDHPNIKLISVLPRFDRIGDILGAKPIFLHGYVVVYESLKANKG